MLERVGSCGIVSQRGIVSPRKPNPMDRIRDAREKRRIARQEARMQYLERKRENEGLTKAEEMELAGYKTERCFEKILDLSNPSGTVIYLA